MSAFVDRAGPSERVLAAIRLAAQARFEDAELLLRDSLARRPQDAWALNALGGIALARQDEETAQRLIGAAATMRPDEPEILANLAGIHHRAGRVDEAFICIDRAVERAPGHAGLRRLRAELLLSSSRAAEAADEAQRALELDPDNAPAWVTRGLVAVAQADIPLAIACFREATALDRGCAEAWHNLAELHDREGDLAQACACAERAYLAKPGDPAAIAAFARRLAEDNPDEAQALVKRALALAPDFLPAVELAARLDLARGEERATLAGLAALVRRSNGKDPAALLVLARVLVAAGRFEQGLQSLDQVLLLRPDDPAARTLRSECLFALGRFAEAWAHREKPPRSAIAAVVVPKTMPVGEIVLAARFLPRLAAGRAEALPVRVDPDLAPLLSGLAGIAVGDLDGPEAGPGLLLPEIMEHLRIEATDLGGEGGYLVADPARSALWCEAVAALPGPRIGFLWHRGSSGVGLADMLAALRPIGTPASLALGDLRGELEAEPAVIDAGCRIGGLQDLAAAISAFDAVVAPDSLVAHLAGALGKPAIVLAGTGHHWAWAAKNARALWYPAVEILAQEKAGDWSKVRADLPARLAALLAPAD